MSSHAPTPTQPAHTPVHGKTRQASIDTPRSPHRFGLRDVSRILRNSLTDTVTDEPETLLAAVGELRIAVDAMESRAVHACRKFGMSWEAIGQELGITKQAAHNRWHHLDGPART